jgi:SOS-response transcriptional repressor LexA
MQSIRLALILAILAGAALPVNIARAERSRRNGTGDVLLAKTKKDKEEREKKPKKEKKHKKEKKEKKEKRKSDQSEGTKRDQSEPKMTSVTGTLAVVATPEGLFRVTVTDDASKTYLLEVPESAIPKAQALAGKWVLVKGHVRDRNGEFLISHIQSCRPVAKVKAKDEAPAEAVPAEGE